MDWQQAKERTLSFWRELGGSIDRLDQVELLREINVVNDLCEKAKEQAHGELGRCSYCIAYQQFGGCMGIALQMSECVMNGNLEELRQLVDRFIAQLEALEAPAATDGSPL